MKSFLSMVAAGFCFLLPLSLSAHGVVYQVKEGRAIVLRAGYDTGEPMSYAEVLIYAPGEEEVEYQNGRIRRIPFSKGYGLLQNLYIDSKRRCFSCTDHFCEGADVSFGDAWLGVLRSEPIKHSMAIPLTQRGLEALNALETNGGAYLVKIAPELAVQSQKRAVIWHTYGSAGRNRVGRVFGMTIPRPEGVNPRWNDYVSAFLILAAYKAYSTWFRPVLMRLPWPLPYCYMLVQKTFLNF